ncbi:MAG: hypothetical protein HN352_01940 [Bacteroidetes bacterium]|jgi:hypothetical protein|nr:hypothetical protein [Bacteroidota bacterium]MBT3747841.1 hypothetical protein [Bacteroidota bacterium]MBT4398265.1 hypothetical protein [Bacteroidota bacterium]MBT4409050.1 hypothetical protein [Bacteroidota bacterium]MBT5425533.1 hypothetical protein [Bacteroidota bacterium]
MLYLGIGLILYGLLVFWITIAKPAKIWNMGKIQGFVKILTELGTRIFFSIWGAAALGFGIFFLLRALAE